MALEPQEAEDDVVYWCLDDEEWKAFLVQGSYGDGVCDCPRSQWLVIQHFIWKRRGELVSCYVQGRGKGLVNKLPSGTDPRRGMIMWLYLE